MAADGSLRPLVHIGYQKAGSTWLQRYLFPNAALGFSGDAVSESTIKNRIIAPHDLDFDAEETRVRLMPSIQKRIGNGLVPVLSAERLCGDLHHRRIDSARNAQRLAGLFPEANILIVVREQKATILATYKQYVSAGGLLSLERYLGGGDGMMQWPFEIEQFEYHRLIEHYVRLFGEPRVLALPLELFRDDGRAFVRRITRFAGAVADETALDTLPYTLRVNQGNEASFVLAKRRLLNPLMRDRLAPWGRFDRRSRVGRKLRKSLRRGGEMLPASWNQWLDERMRKTIEQATRGRYEQSNARTAELIGLDLAEYGYEMPRARLDRAEEQAIASR